MSDLSIINFKGINVIDSRDVADATGKRHSDLLETIGGYVKHLLNGNFRSVDFFIETSYKDSTGRELPCYLLTRKGCDMVANKMTGEKGVLFTAAYVTKFEEMESQQVDTSKLSPSLQMFSQLFNSLAQQELANKELAAAVAETKHEVQAIRDVIAINPTDDWRTKTNIIIAKICVKVKDYEGPKKEIYKALEERAHCDLNVRLKNMKARLALKGSTKTKINNLNFLDVIEEDSRLIEIYKAIVKEMAIKYKVA